MKISIIMASYNYEDYIKEAIESVLIQTYQDWELIIVDDGSSDNSRQVIQSYCNQDARIRLCTHVGNQNKGLAATIQLGISKANAEYLAFLESDDRWLENCLTQRAELLRQDPKLSFLFNEIEPFGDSESVKEILKYQKERHTILAEWTWPTSVVLPFFLMNIVPTFSCVTIKKSVLNTCNFNTPIAPWLDWWLYFQLALTNDFYFLDTVLTQWRRHPRSYIAQSRTKTSLQEKRFFKALLSLLKQSDASTFKKVMASLLTNRRAEKFFRGLFRKMIRSQFGSDRKSSQGSIMTSKWQFLGLPLLKIRDSTDCIRVFVFGIRFFKYRTPLQNLVLNFKNANRLNCLAFDEAIAQEAQRFSIPPSLPALSETKDNQILFLASEFYESGGHSKCVLNLVKLLQGNYNSHVFLTRLHNTQQKAPILLEHLKPWASVEGANLGFFDVQKQIQSAFERIVQVAPKVVFVFAHMDDVFSTLLLALIKEHTPIKIIYFNHGSHFPALGFAFADLVLEGMPTTHYVTKHFRGIDKCHVVGLPDQAKEEIVYISDEEKASLRQSLGLAPHHRLLMSAGASYKFFDGETSPYFKMLNEMLSQDEHSHWVIFSEFNKAEHAIIKQHVDAKNRNRLKIRPFTPAYRAYFQACDVYVDSFPVSGALMQVELMGLKVPTVVKINRDNALWSFHEYFDPSYPYLCETVDEMKVGILELLYHPEKRQVAMEQNFQHYLSHYEAEAVRQKYKALIDGSNRLSDFYDTLDESLIYQFKDLQV